MLFTSGTTGPPKGVYFTHRQLLLHAMAVTIALSYPLYNVGVKDVSMPLIPLFHVHGWGGTPYVVMLSGTRKYVLPGRYDWGGTYLSSFMRRGGHVHRWCTNDTIHPTYSP